MPSKTLKQILPLFLLSLAATVQAADLPQRKSGLWEMTMTGVQTDGKPQTVQTCVEKKTDTGLGSAFGKTKAKNCDDPIIRNQAGKISVTSVCKFAESTVTTNATITGDLNSNYHIERTANFNPPRKGMKQATDVIEARWLSACKAGQRAGDMIMPDGTKFNVQDMQKLQSGK